MHQLNKVSLVLQGKPILTDITFHLKAGKTTGLLGVSGSGKTSLLHVLAGIHPLNSGTIHPPIDQHELAIVLQDHGLFPWKTVRQNIRLGRLRKGQDNKLLEQIIHDLGIESLLDKYPKQLSGGQSQRVAIARALYQEPRLILMDEPTAALDEMNRLNLRKLLKKIQARYPMTLVYVTHQLEEALDLCDELVLLESGKVIQQFSRADIIDRQQLAAYLWEE